MPGKLVIDDSIEDPQELLGKFALRLTRATSGRHDEGYPRLYVGTVPDEFPIEVPLHPDTHVIGTIIKSPGNGQIYAEAQDIPERVVQISDDFLLAEGWRRMAMESDLGGFQPGSSEEFERAHYCKTDSGPALHITARASPEVVSEIDFIYQAEPHGSCNPGARKRMREMHGLRTMIPPLLAPTGTWKSGGGGGGSPDHWRTSAILETEMTVGDVMDHYAEQLNASSWTRLGTIEKGSTLVTYWEFMDSKERPYIVLLDVKKLESQPELRFVHLVISSLDPPRGGSSVVHTPARG